MSFDVLQEKIRAMKNPTVAGLDARIEYVPEHIRQAAYAQYGVGLKGACEAIYQFNVGLMDALCDAYRLHGVVYFHHCRLEKEFLDTAELLRRQERNFYQEFALRIHRIISLIDLWRREHPEVRKSPEGIRLKEYLDANWQENISLGALASLIRKSPAQTLRIFQKDWNCSPYAYLQEQRSFLARQYLENSDYPVKILASMLGFKDEFYFSNWFKEKNGISPSAYRKRFRESLL